MKKIKYLFFIIFIMTATVSFLFSKKDDKYYNDTKGLRGVWYYRTSLLPGKAPKMEGKNVLLPNFDVLFDDDSFEDRKNWFMKYFRRAIPIFDKIPKNKQSAAFDEIMDAFLNSSLTVNSYIYQKIPGKPHHSTTSAR